MFEVLLELRTRGVWRVRHTSSSCAFWSPFREGTHARSKRLQAAGEGGSSRHGFHLTATAIVVICCLLLFPPHSGIISWNSYSNWTREQCWMLRWLAPHCSLILPVTRPVYYIVLHITGMTKLHAIGTVNRQLCRSGNYLLSCHNFALEARAVRSVSGGKSKKEQKKESKGNK